MPRIRLLHSGQAESLLLPVNHGPHGHRRVRKTVEKFLDGVAVRDFRRSLRVTWVGHGACRARFDGTLGYQETEIRPESREAAAYGTWLEAARVKVGEVGPHGHRARL